MDDAAYRCEEAPFNEFREAYLVRPSGGIVSVIAGVVGDSLVFEGDMGLGPADAMATARIFEGLRSNAPDLGEWADTTELEAAKSFLPKVDLYRRAWRQLSQSPDSAAGDQRLAQAIDELDGWRRGQAVLDIRPRGAIVRNLARRWPHDLVHFTISYVGRRDDIMRAICHWRNNTNLQFEEVEDTNVSVLDFKEGPFCSSSAVGCTSTRQFIYLTNGCSVGNVIHEIGHAVGLFHEQSRSDREQHVTILKDNIQPGKCSQFKKYGIEGQDTHQYDYGSIMHYSQYQFSLAHDLPTIVPKIAGVKIGQREKLSGGDIAAIAHLYP